MTTSFIVKENNKMLKMKGVKIEIMDREISIILRGNCTEYENLPNARDKKNF